MEKNNESSIHVITRIAIIGPESTGKTTLAGQLAGHYKSVWVPEYAREYINGLKRKYTLKDIEAIARIQVQREDLKAGQSAGFLFCDTNLVVCKIWAENAFGKCPRWILDEIAQRHYDLCLLADIDLPWVADGQREHPQLREELLGRYKRELEQRKIKYKIVSGVGPERLKNAVHILDQLFTNSPPRRENSFRN